MEILEQSVPLATTVEEVFKVLAAVKAQPDRRVLKVFKVYKEELVPKEHRALLVNREHKELLVLRVLKAYKELQEHKV